MDGLPGEDDPTGPAGSLPTPRALRKPERGGRGITARPDVGRGSSASRGRIRCEGEQKDAPVLGIKFTNGMQRNGLIYENGTILDLRDGSVYSARTELSRDGNRLTVRGYLGIPLLGQSEVWRRLPDSTLEAPDIDACANGGPTRINN